MRRISVILLLTCLAAGRAFAASAPAAIQPLAERLYLLTSDGRNTTICLDEDAVRLIDSPAMLRADVKAAIATLSSKPVMPLLNPPAFRGRGARRPDEAIPQAYRRMEPHATEKTTFCGYTVEAISVGAANTGEDVVIRFVEPNVYLLGDIYFSESFPYLNLSLGGDINGIVTVSDRFAALIDDAAKIVPAYGRIAKRADLRAYHDMVATVRDRVDAAIKNGKPLNVVVEQVRPTAEFDTKWDIGLVRASLFIELVYTSLKGGR